VATVSREALHPAAGAELDLSHRLSVFRKDRVGREEEAVLRSRLREEQSVERIFVQVRQGLDLGGMRRQDRERTESRRLDLSAEVDRRDAERALRKSVLDGDLPDGRRAVEALVRRIRHQGAGGCGEAAVVRHASEGARKMHYMSMFV